MNIAIGPLVLILCAVSVMCGRWWQNRKFRIHLSTLLLLSLCAGGMMWLNVRPIKIGVRIGWPVSVDPQDHGWQDDEENDRYDRYLGWPFLTTKPAYWHMSPSPVEEEFGFYPRIFLNAACAFVLLTLVAWSLEIWISRKRPRASNDKSQMPNQQ